MVAASSDEEAASDCPEPFSVRLDRLLALVCHQFDKKQHKFKAASHKKAR
jgi:hypothetical protein